MRRCRRLGAVNSAASSLILLLLVLLHVPATFWPAIRIPAQQPRQLQSPEAHEGHIYRQNDTQFHSDSCSGWIFASAASCCKNKTQNSDSDDEQGGHGGKPEDSPRAPQIPGQASHQRGGGPSAGGPSCCGVMPMYFVNTTHTIILFKWWETLETWEYVLSICVCVLLGVVSVALKVVRLRVEERLASNGAANDVEDNAQGGVTGDLRATEARDVLGITGSKATCSSKHVNWKQEQQRAEEKRKGLCATVAARFRKSTAGFPLESNCCRMVQAFVLYGFDYLLMLIVMSYNVGLFFAVTGGLAFGFFLFGHLLVSERRASAHYQNQSTQQNVEMQDFHAGDPLCCGA